MQISGWLKPKAAAKYCGVGERTLRTWIKDEGLRSSIIRGTILIKVGWIDEFIQQHETSEEKQVDRIVDSVCRDLSLSN